MRDRYAGAHEIEAERHKGTRIGTLWLKESEGTGDATLTVDFLDRSAIYRADALKDILGVLIAEYNLATAMIFKDHG